MNETMQPMTRAEYAALLRLMDIFGRSYFGEDDDYDGSSEWSDYMQSYELVKRAAERA
jgi:hypothetical protein